MARLDREFLMQFLDMSTEEQVAYLKTLTPEERKETNNKAFKLNGELIAQEMVNNLNSIQKNEK